MMKARLFTILSDRSHPSNVKHYFGVPPELTDGKDARKEARPACFLVIEEKPDGVLLYRFGVRGDCVGDTWHMTIDEAKHQAAYEYEGLALDWQDVPQTVEDVAEYCLSRAGRA